MQSIALVFVFCAVFSQAFAVPVDDVPVASPEVADNVGNPANVQYVLGSDNKEVEAALVPGAENQEDLESRRQARSPYYGGGWGGHGGYHRGGYGGYGHHGGYYGGYPGYGYGSGYGSGWGSPYGYGGYRHGGYGGYRHHGHW